MIGEVDRAVAEFPGLRRLIMLRDQGDWLFQPIEVDGELTLLAGSRGWPGVGRMPSRYVISGMPRRSGATPAGGVVWRREGGLVDVVDGVLELPTPNDSRAPRLVVGTAARLWTP